jgi:hypothetical protein
VFGLLAACAHAVDPAIGQAAAQQYQAREKIQVVALDSAQYGDCAVVELAPRSDTTKPFGVALSRTPEGWTLVKVSPKGGDDYFDLDDVHSEDNCKHVSSASREP